MRRADPEPGGDLTTVESHILEMQRLHPSASGDFTGLLNDITFAAKIIARVVNRAGLVDILGATGTENIQGESVQKLDLYANRTLRRCLGTRGQICLIASEEDAEPLYIEPAEGSGRYTVLFDPLDGSSNIDANVSVGTIFSIYRRISQRDRVAERDLLQAGRLQVAAGYVIYGSSTMFVYTTGHGVHGFTLDPSIGEFLLSHENIRIPFRARLYSVNEGYEPDWLDDVRETVRQLKYGRPEAPDSRMTARYIGSLVADFHRNLLHGGVFLYPATRRMPQGKLRLMYEAAPLAFIAEQAGGYGSDGHGAILDVAPRELHQRTPLFIGCRDTVLWIEQRLGGAGRPPGL